MTGGDIFLRISALSRLGADSRDSRKRVDAPDIETEAKAEYEKALFIEPDYYEAINNLSEICMREGDMVSAKEMLRRAIKLDPSRSLAYVNLGKISLREKNLLSAG